MRRIRRYATILIVWMTAASTMLAGGPHFVCRCPDSSVNRSCCDKVSSVSSGCCAKRSCCARQTSNVNRSVEAVRNNRQRPSCCHLKKTNTTPVVSQPSAKTVGTGPVIHQPRCQRALEESTPQSSTRTIVAAHDFDVGPLVFLPGMDAQILIPLAPATRDIWESHRPLPPTDLIALLHRLTI